MSDNGRTLTFGNFSNTKDSAMVETTDPVSKRASIGVWLTRSEADSVGPTGPNLVRVGVEGDL